MSETDVVALFREVMSKTPAERLFLAWGIMAEKPDAGRQRIACDIAESAINEIRARLLLERKG